MSKKASKRLKKSCCLFRKSNKELSDYYWTICSKLAERILKYGTTQ